MAHHRSGSSTHREATQNARNITFPGIGLARALYPTAPLEKNEQTTETKIKRRYSDGRVELNGGADRIRDAQFSWNTLFQDVPRGLGRFLPPPNGFSSFLHDF